MSACFGAVPATPTHYCSSSGRPGGGGSRPWRWWRAKCAGIAAAVGSRLRRSVKGVDARRGRSRRRAASSSSSPSVWCHHHHHSRSFAPVYVHELYSHQHHHHRPAPAKALRVARREDGPTSASDAKLAAAPPLAHAGTARATGGKATARVGAADAGRVPARVGAADARRVPARAGGAVATAAAAGAGAVRNVLLRSPGRGGGGVLGVVKGMGEVDLRAELFIRKFKEDMRLQSQRSAEEFQAMLARGL